jgi:hypothetical protein
MALVRTKTEPAPLVSSIDEWRSVAPSRGARYVYSRLEDGWYLRIVW